MVGIAMVMKFIVSEDHHSNGTVWMTARRVRNHREYIDHLEAADIYRWCTKKFGIGQRRSIPDSRWCVSIDGHSKYYFKNASDLTFFLLKWT
jgi:hypothetical protein